MKQLLLGIVLTTFVFVAPIAVFADTATTTLSSQVQSLLTQIQNLQAQITTLKALQMQVQTTATSVSSTLQLIRSLSQGMSGSDVTALQTVLASDPTIYPQGTITGYYGSLTAKAVRKFQKKYGIETLGIVGPKTLSKLNQVIKELGLAQENDNNQGNANGNTTGTTNTNNGKRLCIPPGHLIAPGWIKKNGGAAVPTQAVSLCNSRENDNEENHASNPTNATSTPVLVNTASASVTVGGLIHDTASLTVGNNPTGTITFQVYASGDTSCVTPLLPALSPITVNGNGSYTSANFTTTQIGTYSFMARYSGDLKNYSVNTNCGSTGSTVAVTALDTTAPVTTSLLVTPAATTTIVSWTTNELATSAVWYGTTTPPTLVVSSPTLVTSHSLTLSGLATSTVYNYLIVSADASGNAATSTQNTFTTLSGL